MISHKRQTIQLGGQGNGSSHSFLRMNSGILSPSSQSINLVTRQVIISPHKISHKVSPNKQKLPPPRASRQNSGLENSAHNFQLDSSKVSVITRLDKRGLFEQRSNIISPTSKGISLNYSTGASPEQSRNSSFHQQETVSPNKIQLTQTRTQYEIELERKLKIVEVRIGELHRQKQQVAAKLNQENRKIYHQNVTLKHRINDLSKALQKSQRLQSITSQRSQASSAETFALQNSHLQIANLKREIIQLEQCLAQKGSAQTQLLAKNEVLSSNLNKATSLCQSLEQQLRRLNDRVAKKTNDLEQILRQNRDLKVQIQNHQQVKISQSSQIENIRQLAFQNEERYKLILKQYQSKIEEYQNAYNNNQELIQHLQSQLQKYQNDAQSVIKEEAIQESSVHNQLVSQCQELEDNLLTSIQERDAIIQGLNAQNNQLMHQIQQKQQELRQFIEEDEEKTKKLLSASQLLEKVTYKFQELSQRYQELSQKYELQKNKPTKSESIPQKCKKCEELLKTVLRLNNHLNLKKV